MPRRGGSLVERLQQLKHEEDELGYGHPPSTLTSPGLAMSFYVRGRAHRHRASCGALALAWRKTAMELGSLPSFLTSPTQAVYPSHARHHYLATAPRSPCALPARPLPPHVLAYTLLSQRHFFDLSRGPTSPSLCLRAPSPSSTAATSPSALLTSGSADEDGNEDKRSSCSLCRARCGETGTSTETRVGSFQVLGTVLRSERPTRYIWTCTHSTCSSSVTNQKGGEAAARERLFV
ncbi:hypothetical protein K438DRAFT_1989337 [Mycena galopus ATCC 62051]|nr:hypothetical protein K438DRAFT_1989337 [Mycena galopus ATCC 62051]